MILPQIVDKINSLRQFDESFNEIHLFNELLFFVIGFSSSLNGN